MVPAEVLIVRWEEDMLSKPRWRIRVCVYCRRDRGAWRMRFRARMCCREVQERGRSKAGAIGTGRVE